MKRIAILSCLFLILPYGCDLDVPRDSSDTLRSVTGGSLRVGVVQNPPWVVVENGEVRGIEAELVRKLAAELNATVNWMPGPSEEVLTALHQRVLDLAIGGFTDASPWKGRVSFTEPYYEEEIRVGARTGRVIPDDLSGVKVAAAQGSPVLRYLENMDAVPVPLTDPLSAPGFVAAPSWKLERAGLKSGGPVVHRDRHVMAVPKGESALVLRLERFLQGKKMFVTGLLLEIR